MVKTEFTTCQRQYDTVFWSFFYKFRVIVASRFSSITTSNKKKVFYRAAFYNINDLVCNAQHCIMCKPGHQLSSFFLLQPTKFFCLFNNFRKVAPFYVFYAGPPDKPCCKNLIFIVFMWFLDTICCKQERSRYICKFLLLILPCSSEMTRQMFILFQFRVTMCR